MKALFTLTMILAATNLLLIGCSGNDRKKEGNVSESSKFAKKPSLDKQANYYAGLIDSILNKSHLKFKKTEQDNISFYYEPETFLEKNINKLADEAILSRNHCLRLLGNKASPTALRIIYFTDREKLRPFLKMAPKGYALPRTGTLLIVTNDSTRAYHTHELMHIISIDQFEDYAAEPGDWIQEGIAVFADDPCMTYPIHSIAAYLLYSNKLASMDSLFYQFRTLPDMEGYMQAGSVVQFFLENYGLEKFEALWRNGVPGIEEITGKSKTALEKEYLQFLRKAFPRQPSIDWELLNKKGCG
jgi:hypothetical protein